MPEPMNTELLIAQHDDHSHDDHGHDELTEYDSLGSKDIVSGVDEDYHGEDHGSGYDYPRYTTHPPELPHFIQIWFAFHKKSYEKKGLDPYGDPAAGDDLNLVQVLHVGALEEPVPFANYAPWENNVFGIIGALFLVLMTYVVTSPFRNRSKEDVVKKPTRLQAAVESIVETFDDFFCGVLGPENGRRYLPFVGAMFFVVLTFNLMGIIPLMRAPTSTLLITGSLALCTFLTYQFVAWTKLGPKNYFLHLCGYPQNLIQWILAPLMIVLEGISDFVAKPLSLALRLFGNILGKDILLGVMLLLGLMISGGLFSNVGDYIGFPLTFPFYFLALLLSAIQALVFALLSAIYILLVLPHDHDHEEAH